MRFPVDGSGLTFFVERVQPAYKFGTDELIKDEQGQTQNIFDCRVPIEDKFETISVKVFLPKTPQLAPFQRVAFKGLVANTWTVNGRSGVSFSADSVVSADNK